MEYKNTSELSGSISEISITGGSSGGLVEEPELIYKDECYNLIGAAIEVHKTLGCGFLEAVYSHALCAEMDLRNIPYQRESRILINYKGIPLDKYYIADFVCYDKILLEIKATSEHRPEHEAQLLNYLKATNFKLGIILNFGMKSLHYKRLVH